MHILGAGKSIIIQEKVALPYAKSLNTEQFEITCESSLLPHVPDFLKYKHAEKGGRQKAGRGKDDPVVSHRAGTLTHTPKSCSDTMGAGATRARTSSTLSTCLGSVFWPQRSYSFQKCSWHLERGCAASHPLLSSSRAFHRASSHNSATVTKLPSNSAYSPPCYLHQHCLKKT